MPERLNNGPNPEQALEIEKRKQAYLGAILQAREEANNIGAQIELDGKVPGATAARKISEAELAKPGGANNERIQAMIARFKNLEKSYLSATGSEKKNKTIEAIKQHLDLWVSLLEDPTIVTEVGRKNVIKAKK